MENYLLKPVTLNPIDADATCSLILEMKEETRIDLGHSFLVAGSHPTLGEIVVLNSALGSSAYIQL